MKKTLFIFFAIVTLCVTLSAFTISPSVNEACKSCKGRGWFWCNMCDRTGWRDCPMCGGKGYVVFRDGSRETCESCGGQKKFKCGYCDRGHRECDACYGTGKQRYIGH